MIESAHRESRLAQRPERNIVDAFERRLNELYAVAAASAEVRESAAAASLLRAHGIRTVFTSALSSRAVEAVLDAATIELDVFDEVVATSEMGGARRNLVRNVIDDLGLHAARTAAIAAGPLDLYEALAADCGAIVAVATSRHAAWELRRHPHTALTESISEAAQLVASGGPGLRRTSWGASSTA
jgi:hypothetical protein